MPLYTAPLETRSDLIRWLETTTTYRYCYPADEHWELLLSLVDEGLVERIDYTNRFRLRSRA